MCAGGMDSTLHCTALHCTAHFVPCFSLLLRVVVPDWTRGCTGTPPTPSANTPHNRRCFPPLETPRKRPQDGAALKPPQRVAPSHGDSGQSTHRSLGRLGLDLVLGLRGTHWRKENGVRCAQGLGKAQEAAVAATARTRHRHSARRRGGPGAPNPTKPTPTDSW